MFLNTHKISRIPKYEVQDETRIEDTRSIRDFGSTTFSGFKKTQVKKKFLKSLLNESSIEESCFWCIQFIACGSLMEIWDIIIQVLGKHIYIANPKLAIYIDNCYQRFREILLEPRKKIQSYAGGNEHLTRNNNDFRELFAQLCAVCCVSRKKQELKFVTVSDHHFDMFTLPSLLKAPTPNYIKFSSPYLKNGVWTEHDPQELLIASNEFAYYLSREARDEQNAKYWMEWIFAYIRRTEKTTSKGKTGKTDKKSIICNPRYHCLGGRDVSKECASHPVWLLWDLIISEASRIDKKENTKYYVKSCKSLMSLFGIRFQKGCIQKRKSLLYMAINLLCEPVLWDIPIVHPDKKSMVILAKKNIHLLYKQLKKDEQTTDNETTEYMRLLHSNFKTREPREPRETREANPASKGMPPTEWEKRQITNMVYEREKDRLYQ